MHLAWAIVVFGLGRTLFKMISNIWLGIFLFIQRSSCCHPEPSVKSFWIIFKKERYNLDATNDRYSSTYANLFEVFLIERWLVLTTVVWTQGHDLRHDNMDSQDHMNTWCCESSCLRSLWTLPTDWINLLLNGLWSLLSFSTWNITDDILKRTHFFPCKVIIILYWNRGKRLSACSVHQSKTWFVVHTKPTP